MNLNVKLFCVYLLTAYCITPFDTYGEELPVITLKDAVETALEFNRELAAVRHDVKASKHGIREEKSAFLPQVSYRSEAMNSESELFDFDAPEMTEPSNNFFDFGNFGFTGATFTNQFQFSQLIFDRSVIGRIRQSEYQNEAAQWQKTGQMQQVIFDTVSAYLGVLRAQELLIVQQQRFTLAEQQLKTAETNFEVGLRIRTDVLRAELTRSSALRDVVSAEIALKQAQADFNKITGVPLVSRHEFDSQNLSTYNPSEKGIKVLQNYEPMFQTAKENNPSIRVASILLKQREESVKTAKGEFYPRLSAGGNWGFRDQPDLTLEDKEWSIFAVVQIPIFEGGRKIAKVRRTHEELDAETMRYEATVRGVLNAVERSALSLQEGERNLRIAKEAETVAVENHKRFLDLYAEGLADSLDVTQALTELVEAQTDVITSRYGFMRLYAQLLFALGTIPSEPVMYQTPGWLSVIHN